jgi:peptide/nickel transport system permease protein
VSTALARFIAWRLLVAVLFVLVVSSSAFVLVRLAPGDASHEAFDLSAGQASIAAARHRLGLDQSLPAHVASWLGGVARFDLGNSSRDGRPVAGVVASHMAKTASLAGLALVLAVALGLPLGILTGTRPDSLLTSIITVVSLALVCCPPIISTLALLLFAATTGWIAVSPGHYVLPTLALALPLAAMLERLQSQAAAEAFAAPDIAAAAARGVPVHRLVWRHASRQALRPILGVAGIVVATLFSGSVAVEQITSWPGLGGLMLGALQDRDLYLVAGCALAGATLIAVGNFCADLLRAAIDPRVRLVS